MKTKCAVDIRWMIRRDTTDILRIEAECYRNPWTEADFLHCLRQRNCIGMVAESRQGVLGFMVYELHPRHLLLLNLAVDPAHHRDGVGEAMIGRLKSKLSLQRRYQIRAVIRETNLIGQQFLRATGFRAENVIREAYEDTAEDAYEMAYTDPSYAGASQ